jgi:hypothetical protein
MMLWSVDEIDAPQHHLGLNLSLFCIDVPEPIQRIAVEIMIDHGRIARRLHLHTHTLTYAF